MPDQITTLPLADVAQAIVTAGADLVIEVAQESDGHDWPALCAERGIVPLADVRRVTALRMAVAIKRRQQEALIDLALIEAVEQIGVSNVLFVARTSSEDGWMRACDEQAAIATCFADEDDAKAWRQLAMHSLPAVAAALVR